MKALTTIIFFILVTTVYCASENISEVSSSNGKINLNTAGQVDPTSTDSFLCPNQHNIGCSTSYVDCINVCGTNYCVTYNG